MAGHRELTNQFHFVFVAPSPSVGADRAVVQLEMQPETYEEGMVYLEGRRRYFRSLQPATEHQRATRVGH